MGRWTRYRLRIMVGLVLVVGGVVGLVWISRLPPAEQGNRIGILALVLTFVSIVIALVQLEHGRRSADSRPVEVLATLLAQAVYGQWRKAADERRLVTPAPIPTRWSLSDLDVTGPVVAAVGAPDVSPAFPPLPDHITITEGSLRAGGGRRELHQLFAGLASGRIVVVGAPGAGKSGAAVLLVLDAVAHRDSLDEAERARVPVPVLFTGHGWDPNTTSVQDWLRDQLVATYPLFQHRGGDADALVAARDKIALILDGLDEMDEALRPAALQALSDAPFRVVVLTRSKEMVQAASEAWLVGAVAVHLHDVTGPEAADYLQRAGTGPLPAGWPGLLTHLREHSDGVLARGLSTPLTLTLIRDTYQASDNVGELLDATRYRSTEALERHLIARVLPAAYTPRPGRPSPRYSEEQARQALTFIARKMGKERDLAWWRIPSWAPVTPRILATGLVFGLVYGIGIGFGNGLTLKTVSGLMVRVGDGLMSRPGDGLAAWLVYWLVSGPVSGPVVGLVVGLGFVFGLGFRRGVGLGVAAGLGAVYGSVFVFVFEIEGRVVPTLVAGLGLGLGAGLVYRAGGGEPRRFRIASWHAAISRQVLRKGLVVGPGGGLVIGLGYGFMYGPGVGLMVGLMVGLILGLAYILTNMFFQGGASEGSPLGPCEIWRNDRMAGLGAGLVAGLLAGLGIWFVGGLGVGLGLGLVLNLGVILGIGLTAGLGGLGIGIGVALTYPESWPTTLAWLQLRRSGHVPAVSLMPFLEDARERGVLRTVGAVYQFRHATLQDQLAAGQTTPDSVVSPVS